MKKVIFPLYSIISLSVLSVLLLVGFICDRIVSGGTYFYTGLPSFTIDDLRLVFSFLVVILFSSAVIVFLFKNLKKKRLNIIITIVMTIIIIIISFSILLWVLIGVSAFSPLSYVELVSDDGQHHIVIAEDCYLFSLYGGDVYEMTSPHRMKKLTKYEASVDFYTPFSNGDYSVVWNDENFELFYDSDGDGEQDRTILVKYLQ